MAFPVSGICSALFRASKTATQRCLRPIGICPQVSSESHGRPNYVQQHSLTAKSQPLLACIVRSVSTHQSGPPKRPPLSAYILFSNDKRQSVVANNPGVTFPQIGKILGELWRSTGVNDRQVYEQRAKSVREEYHKERESYMSGLSKEEKDLMRKQNSDRRKKLQELRKKRMLKDLDKPKLSAGSGYMVYAAEKMKQERGNSRATDVVRTVASQWNNMSNEEKKPYDEQALRNREQYQTALGQWEARMMDVGHMDLVRGYKPPKPKTDAAKKPKKATAAKKKTTPAMKTTKRDAATQTKRKAKVDKNPSWMREE